MDKPNKPMSTVAFVALLLVMSAAVGIGIGLVGEYTGFKDHSSYLIGGICGLLAVVMVNQRKAAIKAYEDATRGDPE